MFGSKNKSYKFGLYVPKAFKDNYPELNAAYANFGYRDTEQSKVKRKLPPIPTEMDNSRISMTIGNSVKPISPLAQDMYTISTDPPEMRPHGYQTTHNPLYNSSSTTLDSDSSSITPTRHFSSSTDADEPSVAQLSHDMQDMSLQLPSELTNTVTENPLFISDSNNSIKKDTSNQLTVVATMESDYLLKKTNLQSVSEDSDELFIPEPDYDEDEFTIDFKSEDADKLAYNRNSGSTLYKDYEGEDFGQYLSDEDDQTEDIGFTWRKNIRHNYPRKARTEVKRQRSSNQKRAEKLFKSAPKMKGGTVRQNLREFSFADAKISLGKTFKEFSNNRYKKNTEVTADDEHFLRSRNSYEQFLGIRFSQSLEGGNQNWSHKDIDNQKNFERALDLDFTGKLTKKFKISRDSIVGRLTTKLRRKSESSLKIPEN